MAIMAAMVQLSSYWGTQELHERVIGTVSGRKPLIPRFPHTTSQFPRHFSFNLPFDSPFLGP